MTDISILETNLTNLQEIVLIELNKTFNLNFVCKKLSIKQITLSKTIQLLKQKEFIDETSLTLKGKKMAHYLEFKHETISLLLKKFNIEQTNALINQFEKVDYKVIIGLRNLL